MRKFSQELSLRFSFIKELYKWCWRWIWAIIWVLPYGLAGLYGLLQGQEYLPNSWPKLSHLIPPWVYWVWLAIGIVLLIGLTFEGSYRIVRRKIARDIDEKKDLVSGKSLLIPRRQAFESSKVVWGLWHTSNRVKQGHLFEQDSLKRILVIKPDIQSEAVKEIARRSGERPQTIVSQIQDATDDALRLNREIRWYSSYRDISLTIYDSDPPKIDGVLKPCSSDAWMYIEHLVPQVSIDERNYEVVYNKGKEKAIFDGYFKEYEYIWNNQSVEPDLNLVTKKTKHDELELSSSYSKTTKQLQDEKKYKKDRDKLLQSLTRARTRAEGLIKLKANVKLGALSDGFSALIRAEDSYRAVIGKLREGNSYIRKGYDDKVEFLIKLLYRGLELISECKRRNTISEFKISLDGNSEQIIESIKDIIIKGMR